MPLAGLRLGAPVGHGGIAPGSLGAFIRDRHSGQPGILSSTHVLSSSPSGDSADAILMDWEGTINIIATLARAVALTDPCESDAAFALLHFQPEDVGTIDGETRVTGATVNANEGIEVLKRGFGTGVTHGRVEYSNLGKVKLQYGFNVYSVDNLIGIAPTGQVFSKNGDSGSLVVTPEGDAVGLVVGGRLLDPDLKHLTLVTPIDLVLDILKIDLVH